VTDVPGPVNAPVMGYIASGTVLFQIEGEEKPLLKQGEAFPARGRYPHRPLAAVTFWNASWDYFGALT
jgi:hypothetical protein